jgi:hypothetical protein
MLSVAAQLLACEDRHCVDENNLLVDDGRCRNAFARGYGGYHWYYGGYHSGLGSFVSGGSPQRSFVISRGGFGSHSGFGG